MLVKERLEFSPKPNARFAVLDALRFVAAMMVVAYHFLARRHGSWGVAPTSVFPRASTIAMYGAFGVHLFFIISGFVILMTAWGRSRDAYVASRISRLFPAYWACVLATAVLLAFIWPGKKDLSWATVAINMTMSQSAFGVQHVDGVYWTLWTELRFYILVLILMTIGLTYRRMIAFAALWPVLGALAETNGQDFAASALIAQEAPYFAAGISLFLIYRFGHNMLSWLVLAMNAALSLHSAELLLGAIERNTGLPTSPTVGVILILVFYLLICLAVLTPLRKISWRWLTTAGLLTYPLYLLHEYWGWYFIASFRHFMNEYWTLAAALSSCLLMAWLVVRFVERPLGPKIRAAIVRAFSAASDAESSRD